MNKKRRINAATMLVLIGFALYFIFSLCVLAWGYGMNTGYTEQLANEGIKFSAQLFKAVAHLLVGAASDNSFFSHIIFGDVLGLLFMFYIVFTYCFVKKAKTFISATLCIPKIPISQLLFYILFVVECAYMMFSKNATGIVHSINPIAFAGGSWINWVLWVIKILVIVGFAFDLYGSFRNNKGRTAKVYVYIGCLIISNLILLTFQVFGKEVLQDLFRGSLQMLGIVIAGNILVFLARTGLLDVIILAELANDRHSYWYLWWW